MSTLFFYHPIFLEHDTGTGHPENAGRLAAIEAALSGPQFASLERRLAPAATREQILLVHNEAHVDRVMTAVPKAGFGYLDADTVISPQSGSAAMHAAGAVCAAVDAVLANEALNAFCAVRPPGHHAEPDEPMGFCLFNNAAIGAEHARSRHGIERVAIVDFDVHHGNGTQAVFAENPAVLYVSTHQSPWYPGTGSSSETGAGNVVNVPLAAHSGSAEFRAAIRDVVVPRLEQFAPELLLISAGFDAHRDDPLGGLELLEEDYAWVTEVLLGVASRHAAGRVVSVLEGGYDLPALGRSVAAHIAILAAAGR